FELLTGEVPFPYPREEVHSGLLRRLADQRRAGVPAARKYGPVPEPLERIVQRCLAPDPEQRSPSATALAQALEGGRELLCRQRALPPGGVITRFASRSPFLAFALLGVLPHLLGSVVNISYNQLRIIEA